MKKKGFTLIELLAVIVILAIIALIITPIVSDIIESSKKAAAKRSVEGYISAANNAAAVSLIDTNGIKVTSDKYSFETGEVKFTVPAGTIKIKFYQGSQTIYVYEIGPSN